MSLPGSPAVLVLHWWSPLEFGGSFWEVAQDELDVIASYYDIQVGPCMFSLPLMCHILDCTSFRLHKFQRRTLWRSRLELEGPFWRWFRMSWMSLPITTISGRSKFILVSRCGKRVQWKQCTFSVQLGATKDCGTGHAKAVYGVTSMISMC